MWEETDKEEEGDEENEVDDCNGDDEVDEGDGGEGRDCEERICLLVRRVTWFGRKEGKGVSPLGKRRKVLGIWGRTMLVGVSGKLQQVLSTFLHPGIALGIWGGMLVIVTRKVADEVRERRRARVSTLLRHEQYKLLYRDIAFIGRDEDGAY